jgi:hypothetical protein
MSLPKIWPVPLLAVLLLVACQAVPTGPAQDFVAATDTLAQAESEYFDQLQAASDESHVLLGAAIYVQGGPRFSAIAPELTKRDDFSKAKAIRMAVMAQLQNYAQQVAAITAAATGTWIADDSKSATANVTTLLNDQKAAKLTRQQAGLIQIAVQQLASAIVSGATARDLQSLAQQARTPINDIATMVAQDNANIESDNFAPGLMSDQQTAMIAMLNAVYADPRVNSSQRFAAVMAWHAWRPSLVNKGSDISNALAKLVKANEALAAGQPLFAGALANQAAAVAQQALAIPSGAK